MEDLFSYFIRIAPGLIIILAAFFLLPKKQLLAKIFLLIFAFVLMRDAMTPVGFWSFNITESTMWLRFIDSPLILFVLGILSLGAAVSLLLVRDFRSLVRWGDVRSWRTYVFGLLAGLLVASPWIVLGFNVPLEARGGAVAIGLLPALLFMALAGNFLEELLFRGFLQSYFEKHMKSIRAAVVSGLIFAVAHIFLASTVTSLGWPLLVFVLVEGLACAFVYRTYGLLSATIVHGVAIFMLASGLL